MSKARRRQLRDAYRFPGFSPTATVKGTFGDRMALVVRKCRLDPSQQARVLAQGLFLRIEELDLLRVVND